MIKQYKKVMLGLLLLFVFTLQFIEAKNVSLKGKVITIDPGHGGRDSGTRYGNILEKDLNLQISEQLENELVKYGATIYMTRTKDEDLSSPYDKRKKRGDLYRRIRFIEKNKTTLYLSIHINWYNDYYYSGVEILYNNINPKNKKLSESITNEFLKAKIKTREPTTTDLYLYRNTKVPGVLIECGFLSNKNERYLLQTKEYQQEISKIITKGVINYLNT